MNEDDSVLPVQLCPHEIKAGISEEDSIVIASHRESISTASVHGSIDLGKSSFRIICGKSGE